MMMILQIIRGLTLGILIFFVGYSFAYWLDKTFGGNKMVMQSDVIVDQTKDIKNIFSRRGRPPKNDQEKIPPPFQPQQQQQQQPTPYQQPAPTMTPYQQPQQQPPQPQEPTMLEILYSFGMQLEKVNKDYLGLLGYLEGRGLK